MYIDEMLKSEALNRKKNVSKEYVQQALDYETGELISKNTIQEFMVSQEPPFIKLYIDSLLMFQNLSTSLTPVLIAFAHHMTWANTENDYFKHVVRTDSMVREDVARRCGVTDDRVKQVIKELVRNEVFIPIENKEGKRKRGIYFVNPWVLGKGDWQDIKKLRTSFEFVSSKCAISMEFADGTKKTIVPLQYKEPVDRKEQEKIEKEKADRVACKVAQ